MVAFSSGSWVLVGGSRSLSGSGWASVARSVLAAVAAAGCSASVGCCVGGDLAFLSALPAFAPSALPRRVSAVGAASGAGFCSLSAPLGALRLAGPVAWLAGGPLSLPLPARLLRRSLAALAGCSVAVFLAPGSGSLAVAGAAVSSGAVVFAVLPVGAALPAAPRGCSGAWSPAALAGLALPVGFALVVWVPAGPAQLSLF